MNCELQSLGMMKDELSLARIESAKEGTIETSALAKLEQHAQAARGAYASNTERALRTDVATFTAWCAKARCAPLPRFS